MIVPKIQEIFSQVWMSMGLILLLLFSFKITIFAAEEFGAWAAAATFFTLVLAVLYSVIYATTPLSRQ